MREGEHEEARSLYGESLSIYEGIGDRGGKATSLGGLARSASAQGDHAQAAQYFLRALRIAVDVRFVSLTLSLLVGTGRLMSQMGRAERGVELLALVLHHPGSEEETRERAERLLDQQRVGMDREQFALASDRGRGQRLEVEVEDVQVALTSMQGAREARPDGDDLSPATVQQPLVEPLTPRELEVLNLIATGRTNKQIAQDLVLSVGTVKYYTSHIYGKLGVSSRTQAVARARELGLLV
jgi:ATP/maltotriose-dependent transcriptional regulator MalT